MAGLTGGNVYDVVLIGNGALGLGVAYNLRKCDPNLSIAVVGPSHRTGAATMAAGAMINVWSEMAPGQFDNPALAERAELTINAMKMGDDHCAELSEHSQQPLGIKWGPTFSTTSWARRTR